MIGSNQELCWYTLYGTMIRHAICDYRRMMKRLAKSKKVSGDVMLYGTTAQWYLFDKSGLEAQLHRTGLWKTLSIGAIRKEAQNLDGEGLSTFPTLD